ncbi:MAG: universal stress protein [Abditibacteriales bacterium]|nr:universal stress protein [Abditibacteriales bacterium]MDW8366415.1 universal stress protein [Abditibacteriales bacterium]
MIKSILLSTDGSEHAWAAWQYALDIAKAFDAWLRVLSVVDVRALRDHTIATMGGLYPTEPLEPSSPLELEEKLESEQNRLLEEVRSRTQAAGVKVKVSLARGTPSGTILSYEPFVDMIAMGHRGHRSKWEVFFLGSVAEEVLQRAAKPVLMSPARYEPIQRILAAYDASDPSQRALHWAAELAATMSLPLDVVHVNRDRAVGHTLLREADEYLRPYDTIPHVGTILREGKPALQILAVAAERGAGLIVMGAHGHSRVREALLGSTTEEVLRQADKPLLMTR